MPKKVAEIKKEFAGILMEAKKAYISAGGKSKNFEKTNTFKLIKNKERNAVYYSKNYKKISKKRSQKTKEKNRAKGSIKTYSDFIPLYEAFSGNSRAFNKSLEKILNNKGAAFYGIVSVKGNGISKEYFYKKYPDFLMRINILLRSLYGVEQDSSEIFQWYVSRSWEYDEKKNILYAVYRFVIEDDGERDV